MATFGILDELLCDDAVTEIMVNGPSAIFFEKSGKLTRWEKCFNKDEEVLAVIETILAPLGKKVSAEMPYSDARLADGSRVNIVIPPVSLSGPMITIRKFPKQAPSPTFLIEKNAANKAMLEFLKLCVILRKNIIVSGGTGSGKTTLLTILSSFIPEGERIITIEDTAELRITREHIGRLESHPPDKDGKNGVSIRQLLINSLRMRPDRILIGECRGGEALDMLQAMNTGHEGSMTTLHANSPRDCLKRLETMVLMAGFDLPIRAIRDQIASAIDIIIQISRFPDGSRKIISISEVTGMEGDVITLGTIFEFVQTGTNKYGEKVQGDFRATQTIPSFLEEVAAKGLKVDLGMFS